MSKKQPSPPGGMSDYNPMQQIGRVSVIGTEFAVAVGVMAGIGWLLDWWLGTGPWLLFAGAVLGLAVGTYRFVKEGLAVVRSPIKESGHDDPESVGKDQ